MPALGFPNLLKWNDFDQPRLSAVSGRRAGLEFIA
jgi:hypothetical protein